MLKPDVVTASQFDKRSTRELLKANGVNLVELPVPRRLAEVRDQIREMGKIAGHRSAPLPKSRGWMRPLPPARAVARAGISRAAVVAPRLGARARQFCRRDPQ